MTPYKVNGYIDHALDIDLYDWVEENSDYLKDSKDQKKNRLTFANLTDLRAFLEGAHVAEYPNMRTLLEDVQQGQPGSSMSGSRTQRSVTSSLRSRR